MSGGLPGGGGGGRAGAGAARYPKRSRAGCSPAIQGQPDMKERINFINDDGIKSNFLFEGRDLFIPAIAHIYQKGTLKVHFWVSTLQATGCSDYATKQSFVVTILLWHSSCTPEEQQP